MSVGIYMITNKINGKRYIGKSIRVERRFTEHRRAKTDMAISKAIRKYGADNFTYEILELCDKDSLDEKEAYWIEFYGTYTGDDYNSAPGGEGASHPVKLSDNDIECVKWLLYSSDLSSPDIAYLCNVSRKTISDINCGHSRKDIGGIFEYPIRKYNSDGITFSKDELYDLLVKNKGRFYEAAAVIGCTAHTLYSKCRKLGLPTSRNAYESYNDEIDLRKIASEATRDDRRKISKRKSDTKPKLDTSTRQNKRSYSHSDGNAYEEQPYHSKRILQIDVDTNNIVAEYASIRQAARTVGRHHNAITKALNSEGRTSAGYIWKYA